MQRQPGAHGGAAARVDDRVAGDLVEPRAHAGAVRVVALGVAPGAGEDLLDELLGGPALAERVEREAEQLPRVGAVELAQRLAGGVGAQALDQLGVGGHRHPGYTRRGYPEFASASRTEGSGRPEWRTPSANRVGVVATPARTPARQSAAIRGLDGLRAAVGVEARDIEPEPLGALPQMRVLEAALVGEQRVVHLPEAPCSAAASAARAAGQARGWLERTGKWRKATRSGSSRSRSSSAAQNGHSKSA